MDRIMSSWKGASLDEVMRQWGYPHEERVIAGKRLYIWNRQTTTALPAIASSTGTSTLVGNTVFHSGTTTVAGGGTSGWNCTRILEVNAQNRVVGWQWDGNNCPFMEAGPYSNWGRK